MLTEFLHFCAEAREPSEVLAAEVTICSILQMEFAIPCALDFLFCALQQLQWPSMFSVHRGQHDKVSMLAQYLCELSLLSYECAQLPASLVASGALCLALACLRCGLWQDGAPGSCPTPMRYWTPSMVQATGYSPEHLEAVLLWLRIEHEQAYRKLHVLRPPQGTSTALAMEKYEAVRLKFSQPRFLGVIEVPPFASQRGSAQASLPVP